MDIIGRIFGALLDALLAVFGGLSLGGSLAAISMVLGVLMLLLLKWIGDPKALEESMRRMQAHIMEMRLFDREPRLVMVAMGRMFWWNFRLLLSILKPTVVAMLPMILLFVQMEHFYGMRPLRPGESTTVTAKLSEFGAAAAGNIELRSSKHARVLTPPVRSPDRSIVSWQVRGETEGSSPLVLKIGAQEIEKEITVSRTPVVVSKRRARRPEDVLLYPVEPALAAGPVAWVDVRYPSVEVSILGLPMHWLLWLFIISFFGALLVRWFVNARRPGTF